MSQVLSGPGYWLPTLWHPGLPLVLKGKGQEVGAQPFLGSEARCLEHPFPDFSLPRAGSHLYR